MPVRATFVPQAWQNDYAIEVDAEGPTSWSVSAEFLAEHVALFGERALVSRTYESDELRHDPAAPAWIRDWSGPFEMEVEVMREKSMRELVEIVRAAERLRSIIAPLKSAGQVIDDLLVLMPDLGPELAAASEKIADAAEHLLSANNVIEAKMDNWEP